MFEPLSVFEELKKQNQSKLKPSRFQSSIGNALHHAPYCRYEGNSYRYEPLCYPEQRGSAVVFFQLNWEEFYQA